MKMAYKWNIIHVEIIVRFIYNANKIYTNTNEEYTIQMRKIYNGNVNFSGTNKKSITIQVGIIQYKWKIYNANEKCYNTNQKLYNANENKSCQKTTKFAERQPN